ncbi:MAG: PQQ-binding-like beta-propeller repeat protein [Thermoanaerobaculia bacterium]|nr:PQQ-binding-like beta-propeller repeat protein [Thermoanaerobaculia bacterium]
MRSTSIFLGLSLLLLAAPAFASTAVSPREADTTSLPTEFPDFPEGIASFGAAVAGDSLYVFGGHIGRTHHHSVENLSHHLRSLDLTNPSAGWQDAGDVSGLQGTALVAHGDRVCRVGGMTAHNAPDAEEEDLESLADVSCFDTRSGSWTDLPPLPRGRSSHDAVVVGDSLWVVGGWQLRRSEDPVWHDEAAVLDLSNPEAGWHSVPQPFERRALAAAAASGKVFAMGGITHDGISSRVDVFDSATQTWARGPELPLPDGLKGFGLSAFGVGDNVWLSGADGEVHALKVEDDGWALAVAELDQPRFFHRLVPHADRLIFVGGASREGRVTSVEVLTIPDVSEIVAEKVPVDRGDWPGFRGRGDAQASFEAMPLHWSEEEGVAWRAEIPGYGQSAPVVWDGQVYVSSVLGRKKGTLVLSSYDIESGDILWRRRYPASLKIENTEMKSRGAPTPAVDRRGLYVLWESGDLVALDHDGETKWQTSLSEDYGAFEGNHGIGSSPVLTHEAVIVQITHAGPSYFVAFNKKDGEVLWKEDREPGVAWTTPVVVDGPNGQEIVSSYAGHVEALDATTGHRLWHYGGIEKNNVPSVTVDGDSILVASSDASHNFLLKRGVGELGTDHVLWRAEGMASGFGSPLFHGDCVLFVNKAGAATCVDRESGEERWTERLPGSVWAAPLAVGERVYFFTKEGPTAVLEHDTTGARLIASNSLGLDGNVYGVAAVMGAFLVRSGTELVRVGVESEEPGG